MSSHSYFFSGGSGTEWVSRESGGPEEGSCAGNSSERRQTLFLFSGSVYQTRELIPFNPPSQHNSRKLFMCHMRKEN